VRLEHVATRTWLLGAFAGWAVAAWILALAGMGGHVALLPADPALLQALPQPAPSPPDRVGPLSQYAEVAARPLFSSDRRPRPFFLQQATGEGPDANAFDYVLSSVLITPNTKLAILQPSAGGESVVVRFGEAADALPEWRLVELDPRSAVFEGPGGRKALNLRVWDGKGGQPPTAVDAVTDADAAVPADMPAPPPAPPANAAQAGGLGEDKPDPEEAERARQQMESIRKRIEERRAQLRREAGQQPPPGRNP
jgi:general secretion pathway protein N